jgi:hypothetical protein
MLNLPAVNWIELRLQGAGIVSGQGNAGCRTQRADTLRYTGTIEKIHTDVSSQIFLAILLIGFQNRRFPQTTQEQVPHV